MGVTILGWPSFQVLLNFLYKGNENVLYLIQQHITRGLVITQRAAVFCLCFSYYCGTEISKHIFYDLFIAGFRDDSEERIPPSCHLLHRKGLSVHTYLSLKGVMQLFTDIPVSCRQIDFKSLRKGNLAEITGWTKNIFLLCCVLILLPCILRLQWWERTPTGQALVLSTSPLLSY